MEDIRKSLKNIAEEQNLIMGFVLLIMLQTQRQPTRWEHWIVTACCSLIILHMMKGHVLTFVGWVKRKRASKAVAAAVSCAALFMLSACGEAPAPISGITWPQVVDRHMTGILVLVFIVLMELPVIIHASRKRHGARDGKEKNSTI